MGFFPLVAVASRLDTEQLLLVVPLIKRTRLVQTLIALQAAEPCVSCGRDCLGKLGLTGARGPLPQDWPPETAGKSV